MLCHCWFGIRKSIRLVKKLSGEVLAWLCVWIDVQMICTWSSWCHYHPHHFLIHYNPEWFYLSRAWFYLSRASVPRLSWKRGCWPGVCYCAQVYSVYDEETGYCQGLSFLAAALLLHVCTTLVVLHIFHLLPPPVDNIGAMMSAKASAYGSTVGWTFARRIHTYIHTMLSAWRIWWKVIRTVLCCVVYCNCAQWCAHAFEQILQLTCWFRFRFSFLRVFYPVLTRSILFLCC